MLKKKYKDKSREKYIKRSLERFKRRYMCLVVSGFDHTDAVKLARGNAR